MSHTRLGLAEAWGNLQSVRFNQDMSSFICAFQDGLRIFNIDPIREQAHYTEAMVGSVAKVEMLYRTNLVALVSGGRKPKFAENTVMIYDDNSGKMVLEFTCPDPVLAVRMKRDKLVAVCRNQIHVFSFPNNCRKLFSVDTRDNPHGLCEVSPLRCGDREVMVFPGYKTGSVQMMDLFSSEQRVSSAPVVINAHRNELVCLATNQGGSMARIYCINFSCSEEWLCCSSDKGTVHIFALQDYKLNKRSALASIGVPGAYAGSQWSLASFTVPQECACICAFVSSGHIAAVCLDGSFHKYHFSADGIINQAKYDVITELCEDCDWLAMRNN